MTVWMCTVTALHILILGGFPWASEKCTNESMEMTVQKQGQREKLPISVQCPIRSDKWRLSPSSYHLVSTWSHSVILV